MAAVTTALSVAGGLAGMGMNIGQAVKAKKDKEKAQQAASRAAAEIKSIKEQNPFEQVQVPTLGFELAQQNIDRSMQSAIGATKGAGAEGVIGAIPGVLQAGNEAALNLAAQAGEAKYQRDAAQATAQSYINQRATDRKAELGLLDLQGAQSAAAEADARRAAAITGAVESGIGLAGDIYSSTPLYKRQDKTKDVISNTTSGFGTGVKGVNQFLQAQGIPGYFMNPFNK
jgi:hypothetical protein